ncbi:MAG: alkaline phosphatase family protein [Acidimicrobiales bacterium]
MRDKRASSSGGRRSSNGRSAAFGAAILALAGSIGLVAGGAGSAPAGAATDSSTSPVPPHAIKHIVVIDIENESESNTFGPSSPATYLTGTLEKKGVLIENYYAIGHVSLDNYIAQVSGQAPTPTTRDDCLAGFDDVTPGTPASSLGQVDATSGCVYPSSVETIANQLDAVKKPNPKTHVASWRGYEEDMGNDPTRDGGTTCAHPAIGGAPASFATTTDGYVTRHNPFVWFHSIIDKTAECDANVVPLGTVGSDGKPSPSSRLVEDFSKESSTPAFSFITPSVCNDGHDAVCTSPSAAGGTTGGLVAANAWLKDWMPTILDSPAYKAGQMMVLITADEADLDAPNDAASCCNEQPGPNVTEPGGTGPGGGQIGALVLTSSKYIDPGTVDTKGSYNHYSALKTFENLLGITRGGSDGKGHLGMAGQPGLAAFGSDVFDAK